MTNTNVKKSGRIEYRIKPSACVEGYYMHKCERHLLYSGISGSQRGLFGLDKPSGSGGIVAARAGEEWEIEVINKYIEKKSMHMKTEIKGKQISYLKYDADETLSELKKIEEEVRKYKEKRYLYQGCLLATDAFRKKHFRFEEDLYDGQDEDLFVDLTMTYPDLIRADWDDEKEEVVLSVIDIKLARRMKLAHKVQVGLYVRLLKDTIDEYNRTAKESIRVRINRTEGFLWNGGQAEERPFLLSDVEGLIDDYFDDVIPQFVEKLYKSIKDKKIDSLRNEVNRCVGQKCEWCENSTQCLKEMKDSNRMQVIPYLSTYAQEYARSVNAPEDIKGFRNFVSNEDNRKLLSCNRTWEYVLSDNTTIDVQSMAYPFDWETIKKTDYMWRNIRSMTMPRWQDVSVIMTAQKYAGNSRVYALGFYVKEFIRYSENAPEDNGETETAEKWDITEKIFVAKDSSDGEYFRIIKEFTESLYEILDKYDEENRNEQDNKKKKRLQGYVMDSYELKNVEEVLYELLETSTDMELLQKTMGILFWMQGEKLVESGEEQPSREAEYPVIVIINELRKLISLPLPVAYRLPDIIPAMNIGIKKEMYFTKEDYRDFFEIISDVMKSDIIHKVWTENETDLIEKIKNHIRKRFYAEGNLVIKIQVEGGEGGHLVRSISPFSLPGQVTLEKELLKKWYFEVRLEDLLTYHEKRNARLQGIEHALETGTLIRMKITDVQNREREWNGRTYYDRYVKLETDSIPEGFRGDWFSAVLAKEDNLKELYLFDDYKNMGMLPERFNTDAIGILGFIEWERERSKLKLKAKMLVKWGKFALDQDDVGKYVYVGDRFDNSNNSLKIEQQLCILDTTDQDGVITPSGLEETIKTDFAAVESALMGYSNPDGYSFTDSQKKAFRHLYENRLTVLQGPPGTGKTDFIARAVITLCLYYKNTQNRDLKVLVTANSHPAIENVLNMIDKKVGNSSVIRICKAEKFSDGSDAMGNIICIEAETLEKENLQGHPVVVGATNWASWKMRCNQFDLIIIDEASQVRVMDAMLALCRGDQDSTRYLLVGDSDQLPAIIHGKYGVETGTRADYGSVFDFFRTKVKDNNLMLCENFRMNEILLRYSAQKIYGDEYSSYDDNIRNRALSYYRAITVEDLISYILDNFSNKPEDRWPLVFCCIKGATPFDQDRAEVIVTTKLVQAIREAVDCDSDEMFWTGSDEKDGILGIVSPHHKHIEALKDAISEETGMARNELYIGTVDKLQGQQREAVIVSYGVSDLESAVTEGEFIFNRNRLNVALTRAKCKSITIFSDILTKPSPEMLDTDDEDMQHGIEFVCGFQDFMKNEEADTETESKGFDLMLDNGAVVRIEVFRKRMKV